MQAGATALSNPFARVGHAGQPPSTAKLAANLAAKLAAMLCTCWSTSHSSWKRRRSSLHRRQFEVGGWVG